jgi:hypothetical protein
MKTYIFLFAMTVLNSIPAFAQCEKLLIDGEEQYNRKNYKKALEYFDRALKSNCPSAGDWVQKCSNAISAVTIEAANARTIKAEARAQAAIEAKAIAEAEVEKALTAAELAEARAKAAETAIIEARAKAMAEIAASESANKMRNTMRRMVAVNVDSNPTQSLVGGDRYKGEVAGNVRSGLGVYCWEDGTIYLGKFENDVIHGEGIYIAAEGFQVSNCPYCIYYSGNFEEGLKTGSGQCYDELGHLLYNGAFENGKPLLEYSDKSNPKATCKFELINCGDGDMYMGSTQEGQKSGLGVYTWSNGNLWFGVWKKGRRAGYGIYMSSSGSVTRGIWDGDEYF